MDPLQEMKLRLEVNNEVAQDIAKSLLKVADLLKHCCRCEPLSFDKAVSLFEVLAYEIDKKSVIWGFNAEEQAFAAGIDDPRVIQAMRQAANEVNKGRSRLMPKKSKDWRKTLGFDVDEQPTEEALKKAFRCRARETHPDLQDGDDDSAFQEVNEAYDDAKVELFGKSKPVQASPDVEHGTHTSETGETTRGPVCPNCKKLKP
jgi:hypothetical protein